MKCLHCRLSITEESSTSYYCDACGAMTQKLQTGGIHWFNGGEMHRSIGGVCLVTVEMEECDAS